MVTSRVVFLPSTLFTTTIILFTAFSVCLVLIWLRNRFRGVGLVLPFLTVPVLALPFLFYFHPGINVYGTFDSVLIGSWIIDIIFLAGCFFLNPKIKPRKLKTYEESKGPTFEMPKVLYMERPVYIKSHENGGIDPYDVLGVSRSSSTDEIETAYKRQILKYHPDKYHGLPDNVIDLSRRETERLNQAFEAIKRERNV
jgi:hypothetical protein